MSMLLKWRDSIDRFVRQIPVEILLGTFACFLLTAILTFEMQPATEDVSNLIRRTQVIVIFAFLLGMIGVIYRYVERFSIRKTGLGWVAFGCYLGLFWTLYSHLTTLVFSLVSTNWVATASLWYVQLDASWGVYGWLDTVIAFFVSNSFWYELVAFCYPYTLNFAVMTIFVIAFFSAPLARQYLLAAFVSILIAAPLWLAFPAIAPYQLSMTDSFIQTQSQAGIAEATKPVAALHAKFADTHWATSVAAYSEYWETETESLGHAVSSNPSAHVMWGVLMTVFLWRANRMLGIASFTFTVFQVIGTMLFLQHYLIDLPAGLLVALLSIYISRYLFVFEKEHLSVASKFWFHPFYRLQNAREKLVRT